jgi:hypothetical protein
MASSLSAQLHSCSNYLQRCSGGSAALKRKPWSTTGEIHVYNYIDRVMLKWTWPISNKVYCKTKLKKPLATMHRLTNFQQTSGTSQTNYVMIESNRSKLVKTRNNVQKSKNVATDPPYVYLFLVGSCTYHVGMTMTMTKEQRRFQGFEARARKTWGRISRILFTNHQQQQLDRNTVGAWIQ